MKNLKTCLLASAASICLAAPAIAQDAGSNDVSDVVVVTAQKREQNIQEVPAAVAALSGEALNDRGINDPSDLQFYTPSLQVGNSQGNTAYTIRGVGFNTVGSPAVAVHVDGVYQPRPSVGNLAQLDVERVEVLRGPQGTLYGRNANAGVISFISKRPTDELEGYVRAQYATFEETHIEAVANVPLNDWLGARFLVAHNDQRKGFIENIAGGPDYFDEGYFAARLAIDADFTENLSLQLTGSYIERDGAVYPSVAQTTPFTSGARGAPFGNLFAFGGDLYAALGAVHTTEPNKTTANDPAGSDREAIVLSAIFDWDLGDFNLRSVTGYQENQDHHWSDFDGASVTIYQGRILRDSDAITQELNLTGTLGPLDIVLGGFYMDESYTNDLSIDEPNGNGSFQPGALLSFDTPMYDSTTKAVFADVTWNITDRLRLVGGFRHSNDKQNVYQNFNIFADIEVAPGTFITLGNQCDGALPELNYNSTTPRGGVQYDVAENSTIYANYTEGFKVGGYNTDGTCNNEYLPEEIQAYEIGWKSTLLDGTLLLNATGFFYDYTNLQLQQIIGTGVDIINAPAAEVLGFELEAGWTASDYLQVYGSLAFLDAEYTEFVNVDGSVPIPPGGSPTPVDVSGNRLNSAPKFSINAGFNYTPDVPVFGGSISLRPDISYRSEVFLREFNTVPQERQEGYVIANGSLAWTNADENLQIRLFATNIFDKEYLTQVQWSAPTNARTVSYGQPRQYGVEVRVDF